MGVPGPGPGAILSAARSVSHFSNGSHRKSASVRNRQSACTRRNARIVFWWYLVSTPRACWRTSNAAKCDSMGAVWWWDAASSSGVMTPRADQLDFPLQVGECFPGSLFVPAPGRPLHHPPGVIPEFGRVRRRFCRDAVAPVGPVVSRAERSFPRTRHRANRSPCWTTISAPAGTGRVVVFLNTVPIAIPSSSCLRSVSAQGTPQFVGEVQSQRVLPANESRDRRSLNSRFLGDPEQRQPAVDDRLTQGVGNR